MSKERYKKYKVMNEAFNPRTLSKYGVTRDPNHDFTDDGHRFTSYLYKGVVPISYTRGYGEVFLSIRFDVLNDIRYEDYRKFPSYKYSDKYNGVDENSVDVDDFIYGLKLAYKDIQDFRKENISKNHRHTVASKRSVSANNLNESATAEGKIVITEDPYYVIAFDDGEGMYYYSHKGSYNVDFRGDRYYDIYRISDDLDDAAVFDTEDEAEEYVDTANEYLFDFYKQINDKDSRYGGGFDFDFNNGSIEDFIDWVGEMHVVKIGDDEPKVYSVTSDEVTDQSDRPLYIDKDLEDADGVFLHDIKIDKTVTESYDKQEKTISKVKRAIDNFAGQITVNSKWEKDVEEFLLKKGISFMKDDSNLSKGKITFKLGYKKLKESYPINAFSNAQSKTFDRLDNILSKFKSLDRKYVPRKSIDGTDKVMLSKSGKDFVNIYKDGSFEILDDNGKVTARVRDINDFSDNDLGVIFKKELNIEESLKEDPLYDIEEDEESLKESLLKIGLFS